MKKVRYQYRVGDHVKLIANNCGSINRVGDIGVVVEVEDTDCDGTYSQDSCKVQVPGRRGGECVSNWSNFDELELVEAAKTPVPLDDRFVVVSKEFVKKAYKAACTEWKARLLHEFPELLDSEKTYRIGDRFSVQGFGDEFILCQVGVGQVSLINLESGNRLSAAISVPDVLKITYSEMLKITSRQSFTKL